MATRAVQPGRPVKLSRWRINALLLLVGVFGLRMIFQLYSLQVTRGPELSTMAYNEIDRTVTLQPRRGTIRDSAGNVLALDVDRDSLYVIPKLIQPEDAAKLSLVLAGLLGQPATDIQAKLLDHDRYWTPLKRWLEPEISDRIAALNEPGLQLVPEPRRVYPQGDYAAHAIGAANFEGVGISGVEGFYDSQLKGITGTITAEWDQAGNPIWLNPPKTQPESDGADLELTLDPLVQHVVETELHRAVEQFKPSHATVIVLEPSTGAIRGMASYPSFDPNRYNEYDPEMYNINPAIAQIYEPGSTFKVATVSIGLETKSFTTDTVVEDTGVVDFGDTTIGNWNGGANGPLTPEKVLYFSSNVGALKLNALTGEERFYKKVAELGYGKPTGVDMAGEGGGIVKDPASGNYNPIDLSVNAFGQGIAVTPLQQVRMMATVGNDGKEMQPYIVQKICHADVCQETKPKQVAQPLSPEVTRTVREMLVNSANHYAPIVWAGVSGDWGDSWLVPGYRVCAKTGTSDIPDGEGGYTGHVIGSVLGLAPADQPRYAVLVKIDEPEGDAYGLVSAVPTYQAIVEQLLRYQRIPPNPDLVGPGQTIGPVRQPEG